MAEVVSALSKIIVVSKNDLAALLIWKQDD